MTNLCRRCGQVLKDNDRVYVVIETDYRFLPSRVAFAISGHIYEADNRTFEHKECPEGEGE